MYDGSYYAKGRAVFRSPIRTDRGFKMGFRVCDLSDGVGDDGAQEIADALNAADSKRKMDAAIEANRADRPYAVVASIANTPVELQLQQLCDEMRSVSVSYIPALSKPFSVYLHPHPKGTCRAGYGKTLAEAIAQAQHEAGFKAGS